MRSGFAAVVALVAFATLANAQDNKQDNKPDGKPTDQANAPEPYQPGLGEIMALQQMRHIKLWFAGNASNWPLADYEIGELKEGFEDVGSQLGNDIIEQHVGAPLVALQKAVDGKNHGAFVTAFDKLSAGCNACHHALDHAFIAIQRPTSLPYSNQSFAPQK
jgi:hypothetical protein